MQPVITEFVFSEQGS